MPTFHYVAFDADNRKTKGYVEADSPARAMTMLRDKGLTPLKFSPVAEGGSARPGAMLSRLIGKGGIRISESFYYLGILIQSGHSLAKGLDLIGRMTTGRGSRIWLDIRDKVEQGTPFSRALEDYPRQFPAVYVGMIRVAESTGRLGAVLEQVARNEERRSEVQGRLATAMAYPGVILCVGLGAVWFLLANVLPKIATIFQASGSELPATTSMLLAVSGVMESLGAGVLLVPLALALGAVAAVRRIPAAGLLLSRMTWRIPVVQKFLLARFSGLLGFQIEAGIPLVQAMESSARAVPSPFLRAKILEARQEVAAGRPLDKVLEAQGIFPEVYILTLASGQRTGQLGPFLTRVTGIMERDVDNVLKRIVALAEPLLILGVGLVIAFIVVAILEPIFNLTTLVK
ncbi:general secretion pathway protein F/type IV pilus assembly protein PilC [Desulfobaculum xiamenense]|uniref:General secretion pathway protein F n=1 Tax=Desulfobaculum xiamenense TaxID=995050 RepID=A0A846QKK3_9BACT|nr:type II secretion system F family protein [Desulfobaculum xiamenense]NJB68661.1 general secretion pathway protein F/type IV pilus assembly protein PilC [Desulfobaculum xiamenense]